MIPPWHFVRRNPQAVGAYVQWLHNVTPPWFLRRVVQIQVHPLLYDEQFSFQRVPCTRNVIDTFVVDGKKNERDNSGQPDIGKRYGALG